MHRGYLLWALDRGGFECKVLFDTPTAMRSKKTWDAYALADRLLPSLTQWHPGAISISWNVFDRGGGSSLSRLLRRRQFLALQRTEDRE